MTKDILGWDSPAQPNCFLVEGKITRKPAEIANLLQDFFTQKIKKLMTNLKKSNLDPLKTLKTAFLKWEKTGNLPQFSLKEISVRETESLIQGLGNSSACGQDGLDAKTIKLVGDYLAPQINNIINSSITTKTFPVKWKLGKIIPILKSAQDSRLLPSSFRPISLLPTLSKLTERAVQKQVQLHFENQGLLHPNSHAYRRNKSTSTAVLQIMDNIFHATDKNLITSLMALDQSAAFDCVSPQYIVRKTENLQLQSRHIGMVEKLPIL